MNFSFFTQELYAASFFYTVIWKLPFALKLFQRHNNIQQSVLFVIKYNSFKSSQPPSQKLSQDNHSSANYLPPKYSSLGCAGRGRQKAKSTLIAPGQNERTAKRAGASRVLYIPSPRTIATMRQQFIISRTDSRIISPRLRTA